MLGRGFSQQFPGFLGILPTGFAMIAIFTGSQAVLQVEVENRVRGAFTAMFYNFSYFGMLALGGSVLGNLATWLGLPFTMGLAAICCLSASGWYLMRERAQPEVLAVHS